jgi:penicillin-binding protein 1A
VLIRTTFDPAMQAAAEAALEEIFANQVREGSEAQAAIVVMSADGAVRAMVGGRDTQGAGLFNRATQAMRQTGSAFKPFVYATALDLGWRFDDMILDAPLTIDVPGSGPYSPTNYSNEFYGDVTLTDALARSLNIPAVRLSERSAAIWCAPWPPSSGSKAIWPMVRRWRWARRNRRCWR